MYLATRAEVAGRSAQQKATTTAVGSKIPVRISNGIFEEFCCFLLHWKNLTGKDSIFVM
jgi:hypothetical protein